MKTTEGGRGEKENPKKIQQRAREREKKNFL